MKTALLAVLALVPAGAQVNLPKQQAAPPPSSVAAKAPAPGAISVDRSGGTSVTLDGLEKDLDQHLRTISSKDPCYLLGLTRGLYLSGYGAVFTAEMDLLSANLGNGLFGAAVTPDQKEAVHKRKLANVPLVQTAVREWIASLATSPALKNMADTDQIVVAVRMVYRPFEDTNGLPDRIIARADRHGSNIKVEVK